MKYLYLSIVSMLLAATACSNDPDGSDPVMITFVEDAGHTDNPTPDAGPRDDASSTDLVDQAPDEDATDPPDATAEDASPDEGPDGTVCQTKDVPVQLANTCTFEWSTCDDGVDYAFVCNIQNVAGNIFSLCNCFENGVMDPADKIVDICSLDDWAEIEAVVNEECGWDLR